MIYQENKNKGGRPKAVKGKARTKTISTRLTLAEWKTVMKRITDAGKKPSHFLRELLLYGKVVAARTQEDRQQIRMLEGGCKLFVRESPSCLRMTSLLLCFNQ